MFILGGWSPVFPGFFDVRIIPGRSRRRRNRYKGAIGELRKYAAAPAIIPVGRQYARSLSRQPAGASTIGLFTDGIAPRRKFALRQILVNAFIDADK